jgi:cation diffusion facilitator family transporter
LLTNRKIKVAKLSIGSNSVLIILKVVAGLLSGSISIVSEAIHSSMDLVASVIAFFSVTMSSKPADKKHPYGHGKIENVSGVIEGLLIFIAAVLIISEAVKKILNPPEISDTMVGVGVMLFASMVNIIVSRILYKAAKEEDSIALEADALHLKTDVYTSLGVAVGLLLIWITKISILDPIVAILVALLILKEACELCRSAFGPLLDTKLSDEDEAKIKEIMDRYCDKILDYHQLRTRKSGNIKYIDFHLTVREGLTVKETHEMSDDMEREMELALRNTNVNIHFEPGKVSEPEEEEAVRQCEKPDSEEYK